MANHTDDMSHAVAVTIALLWGAVAGALYGFVLAVKIAMLATIAIAAEGNPPDGSVAFFLHWMGVCALVGGAVGIMMYGLSAALCTCIRMYLRWMDKANP